MPTIAERTNLIAAPHEIEFAPPSESSPTMGRPAGQPTFPQRSQFLASPLPSGMTFQPDSLRQFYRGGVPQQRTFPLP